MNGHFESTNNSKTSESKGINITGPDKMNEPVQNEGLNDVIKHVLVTGGAGYLGSTLVPMLLTDGYKVTIYDLFLWGVQSLYHIAYHPNINIIHGDVCDVTKLAKVMQDCDAVIHLAAIVGYPACEKDSDLARKVNEGGTKNVVQCLRPHQKLIYASTGSCYGAVEGVCTEDTAISPLTLYGRTKAKGEELVCSAGGVGLRLATVFGVAPRMRLDLLINDLTSKAVFDKHIEVYQANFRRTFLHVRDAAYAFLLALKSYKQMQGKKYNIGHESMNMTKGEVVKQIQDVVQECCFSMSGKGEDKDRRNYEVSYAMIRKFDFEPTMTVREGIEELMKVVPYMNEVELKRARNV